MTPSPDCARLLLSEAAFVRALAARLVADEADDVVQQAWVRALESRPQSIADPRRWLASIVRNLAADRARARCRAAQRELRAAAHERVPSALELVEIEERRRQLVDAVNALPAPQRTVVLLRYYEGLPPRSIGRALGLPATTVSNRLHAALKRLRERLDGEHGGDRRSWLLPLVPFAASPRALPPVTPAAVPAATAGGVLTGAIAMTTKTKLVAAVAAACTLALVLTLQPFAAAPGDSRGDPDTAGLAAAAALPAEDQAAAAPPAEPAPRQQVEVPEVAAAPAAGSLVVHVRFPDEPAAAAGMTLELQRALGHHRFGLLRAVTDENGDARFDGLPPGEVVVRPPRMVAGVRAEVAAGEETRCTLRLPAGIHLSGVVVDGSGAPVAGALIETGLGALARRDACVAATTAADGTFAVRHCFQHCVVGARAAGFAASTLQYVAGEPGDGRTVRIVLGEPGGVVAGQVVDEERRPVAGAVVRVGEGRRTSLRTTPMGAPPLPEQVVTDDEGRFRAIGVPVGSQPVLVADGHRAPWQGTCEVVAKGTSTLSVVLSPGVRCEGVVRDDGGAAIPGAEVTLGGDGGFLEQLARTGADGAFAMGGLVPAQEHGLRARHDRHGQGRIAIRGGPGETVRCEITVSRGLELRGRVVDGDGAPLARVHVETRHETKTGQKYWFGSIFTDGDGRFAIPNCEPGVPIDLRLRTRDRLPVVREGVDPRAGELAIEMPDDARPRAVVRGRLLAPDGSTPRGAEVLLSCEGLQGGFCELADDGAFSVEVPPGEWSLRIMHPEHPTIHRNAGALQSGQVWELGTLQLAVGGTVVVKPTGEDGARFTVCDPEGAFVCGIYNPDPPPRSELLAPGDYVLLVRGEGIATALVPFAVRAGAATEVAPVIAAGVRTRFRFERGGGGGDRTLELRQGDELRAWAFASGNRADGEVFLAPGDYTVRVKGSPRAAVAFTVGDREGAPVVVDLR